jgi:Ca2+-binding EF-hand superfamily protein
MEAYELFDNRNKGHIDSHGLAEAMKVLGYQVDKKQVH